MCWAGWTGRVAEASWPGMIFGTRLGVPVPGAFCRRRVSCGLAEGGAGSGPAQFWPSVPVDERTGLSEAFSHLFKGKELCRYID